ncbi:glutamyl-tRNA reductase [Cyclobacterium qasimii M12-11B]|uniref:Glutamyl-tRNA reductase n=3 Tax=Cyclobacterium qasimii TaxID=1350429 RepID=S7VIZ7_9BACT|nr:glutamyl-tRNA reductase [Cyclobacterium qasimii M12-11B]GEO22364.1 hypothetical protein CQA01_28980 [Cyclobacterium qasimii]
MGQFRLLSFSGNLYNLKNDAFYLSTEENKQLLYTLKSWPEIKELIILSIPERTEIIYFSDLDLEERIFEAITDATLSGGMPIKSEFHQTSDEEKLLIHLSELCFGVQSSNYGTTPLFPRFIQAYNLSLENGMVGEYLERWWNNLIATNKRIKEQVDYQLPNFSITYTVSDLITELVKSVKHPKIAIIGLNALSKRIYKNLTSKGFNKITIVDKSIAPFSTLPEMDLNNFIFEPMSEVENVINKNDILISTLENSLQILHPAYFQKDFDTTKIFIDLSIKSNLTAIFNENHQVIPFNLTDIYKIVEQKMEINKKWLKKAKPIISEMNLEFFHWIDDKKGQEMLTLANELLVKNINNSQYTKVLIADEPFFKAVMSDNHINKILLKKSIARIKSNAQYKDIINYDKIVNDFYQYN